MLVGLELLWLFSRKENTKCGARLNKYWKAGSRIRELADNIDNEPEWFRKWILLRAEAAAQGVRP